MFKYLQKLEKGFTLQEMLFVVVIILVILGISTQIIGNVIKNSDTEEFVSNAKLVEESSHAYYRDNGKYPTGSTTYVATAPTLGEEVNTSIESVAASDNKISDHSRLIIISRLVENGVTNAEQVYSQLLKDGKFKSLDSNKLSDYSRINKDSFGFSEFIIVDLVDGDKLGGKYGVYENDIAGYVFSSNTRSKTSGLTYSGSYEIADDELSKVIDNATNLDKGKNDDIADKNLYPYSFKVQNVKTNGTNADVTLTWTNKFTDALGDLETFKGYIGTTYEIIVYDKNKNPLPKYTTTVTGGKTSVDLTLPVDEYFMTLQAKEISYAGNIVTNKKSEKVGLGNGIGSDGSGTGGDGGTGGTEEGNGTGSCLFGCPGTSIDLNDKLIGGGENGDGDGSITVPVCDTCGLEEIVGGDLIDGGEIYDKLQEFSGFGKDLVTADKFGLNIKSITSGDIIVLREVKKDGSAYKVNKERTFVFKASAATVKIPKTPYLQKDFQVNAESNYIYVLEVYKYKLNTATGNKTPKKSVEVYYK